MTVIPFGRAQRRQRHALALKVQHQIGRVISILERVPLDDLSRRRMVDALNGHRTLLAGNDPTLATIDAAQNTIDQILAHVEQEIP